MTTTSASVIYPELPVPLTSGDLQQLFNPSFDERKWAPSVPRTPEAQVALLVHLKIFQTIGRFLSVGNVPFAPVEYVARRTAVEAEATLICPIRTHYRHRHAILSRLKVSAWGAEARALAQATMCKTARARTDPADIINSAIDAIIRHDFELPPLATFRRLAGTWHSKTNTAQWAEVCGRLSSAQHGMLETLLVVDPKTQKSPFANLAQALFTAQGGHQALVQSCNEHLHHEKQNWRPFARAMFAPLRSALVQLVEILPLQGTADSDGLLCLARALKSEASHSDYLSIDGVAPNTLPREWHALVHDHASETRVFNRRQLEVVAILELANAIKAGEVFVSGSLNFDRFWDRLPCEAADSAAVAAYATSRGWTDGADGLVRVVKRSLDQKAHFLDAAVGTGQQANLQRGRHGRPVVSRLRAVGTPATAVDLEIQMMAHMPERAVLEAIANTEHWAQWGRHFGLPSRLGPQIKDASHRYVLTTFAYGCGLGPTEAARHLGGTVSADQLAFADRRHVDIEDLRAASADLISLYSQFELPQQWGTGKSAAADGTHFETYEDNLLAEHHTHAKRGSERHFDGDSLSPAENTVIANARELTKEHGSKLSEAVASELETRLRGERIFIGELVKHGEARYQFDEKNDPSYFVTLKTKEGEKTIWGKQLSSAMEHAALRNGDAVVLRNTGQKGVEISERIYDEAGNLTGTRPKSVNLNEWTAAPLSRFSVMEKGKMESKSLQGAPQLSRSITLQHDRASAMSNPIQQQSSRTGDRPQPDRDR